MHSSAGRQLQQCLAPALLAPRNGPYICPYSHGPNQLHAAHTGHAPVPTPSPFPPLLPARVPASDCVILAAPLTCVPASQGPHWSLGLVRGSSRPDTQRRVPTSGTMPSTSPVNTRMRREATGKREEGVGSSGGEQQGERAARRSRGGGGIRRDDQGQLKARHPTTSAHKRHHAVFHP